MSSTFASGLPLSEISAALLHHFRALTDDYCLHCAFALSAKHNLDLCIEPPSLIFHLFDIPTPGRRANGHDAIISFALLHPNAQHLVLPRRSIPPPRSRARVSSGDSTNEAMSGQPENTSLSGGGGDGVDASGSSQTHPSRRRHRAGRKKRNSRRRSFAAVAAPVPDQPEQPNLQVPAIHIPRASFYVGAQNSSSTSLESDALLDHRCVTRRAGVVILCGCLDT